MFKIMMAGAVGFLLGVAADAALSWWQPRPLPVDPCGLDYAGREAMWLDHCVSTLRASQHDCVIMAMSARMHCALPPFNPPNEDPYVPRSGR